MIGIAQEHGRAPPWNSLDNNDGNDYFPSAVVYTGHRPKTDKKTIVVVPRTSMFVFRHQGDAHH